MCISLCYINKKGLLCIGLWITDEPMSDRTGKDNAAKLNETTILYWYLDLDNSDMKQFQPYMFLPMLFQ